ncbi:MULTISPECIES: hypothetical protein [Halobacterium]|uniref:hypothetical protein n=1 Tax=Halobacterium TaxID=2239 RepID=UPI00073F8EF4|nr:MULTISPECIES: hypothetical protein [Halobacterium]MCG1002715.1 hypothetical protein [Halobacterium noricense]
MDRLRFAYDAVRAYVYVLLFVGVGTVVWLLAPQVVAAPEVAGLWFAVGAFGALVLVVFVLAQFTRS